MVCSRNSATQCIRVVQTDTRFSKNKGICASRRCILIKLPSNRGLEGKANSNLDSRHFEPITGQNRRLFGINYVRDGYVPSPLAAILRGVHGVVVSVSGALSHGATRCPIEAIGMLTLCRPPTLNEEMAIGIDQWPTVSGTVWRLRGIGQSCLIVADQLDGFSPSAFGWG